MDCIVHGVANSWTRLSNFHFSLSVNMLMFVWAHIKTSQMPSPLGSLCLQDIHYTDTRFKIIT